MNGKGNILPLVDSEFQVLESEFLISTQLDENLNGELEVHAARTTIMVFSNSTLLLIQNLAT